MWWAQILNQLAPLQLATGDVTGAGNMLSSSLTLARSLHDLPTQVCSYMVQGRVTRAVLSPWHCTWGTAGWQYGTAGLHIVEATAS